MSTTRVEIEHLTKTLEKTFINFGTPTNTATLVVNLLIEAELVGYPSHGVLRGIDYLNDIKKGLLNPKAHPEYKDISKSVGFIDGQRSFGVLSSQAVVANLSNLLKQNEIALVGLGNSSHLGRLATIGKEAAVLGMIVIGFVNYLGRGQKALPWQGTKPRFCTNPLLFCCPRPNGLPPIVIDFSSTVVSEGAVRNHFQKDEKVPFGWLVDEKWQNVNDPSLFYTDPMQAFLKPLGGEFGHKGYILALMIEILAGIITNAGHIATPQTEGNGGLFIGFKPSVLGFGQEIINFELEKLIEYLKQTPSQEFTSGVEIPGEHSAKKEQFNRKKGLVDLPTKTWNQLQKIFEKET